MRITIARRLCPYFFRKHFRLLLPGVGRVVEIDQNDRVEQDLERGEICFRGSGEKIIGKPGCQETLSLGNHKAQDWELMCRRNDPKEIFPYWHKLGRTLGESESLNIPLEKLMERFENEFGENTAPSLELVKRGAQTIREYLFRQEGSTLHILPDLPKELHCGRFIHIECLGIGHLDFEWSKKKIKRLVLHATEPTNATLHIQKGLTQCRIRKDKLDKGKPFKLSSPLTLEPGRRVILDHFTR